MQDLHRSCLESPEKQNIRIKFNKKEQKVRSIFSDKEKKNL